MNETIRAVYFVIRYQPRCGVVAEADSSIQGISVSTRKAPPPYKPPARDIYTSAVKGLTKASFKLYVFLTSGSAQLKYHVQNIVIIILSKSSR